MKIILDRKKIFASALFVFVSLAGVAYAAGDSNIGEESKTQKQLQIEDQINVQTKQKLQDESGDGSQVQNQNLIENKGEENKIQNSEQEEAEKQDKTNPDATQRRSQVANAVQEMLQVADRNEGIGQQVRIIAQTQTENKEKLESGLEKIQTRSNISKFLIGPKYNEIDTLSKLLVQNREQVNQLNQIKNQLSNTGDQQVLTEQIKTLEQYNLEIENSLGSEGKGFSLFGWLVKMF